MFRGPQSSEPLSAPELGAQKTNLQFPFYHLVAMRLWAGCLELLGFSVPSCEMGGNIYLTRVGED